MTDEQRINLLTAALRWYASPTTWGAPPPYWPRSKHGLAVGVDVEVVCQLRRR